MAMIDVLNRFANTLAVTATGDATSAVDFKSAFTQSNGRPSLQAVIKIDVAADFTTTDETYTFSITTDDNTAFSSKATVVSRTIAASALTLNSLHVIDIPDNVNLERWVGLTHTLGGTTPSVTYSAWLTEKGTLTNLVKYPNGYDA